MSNNHASKEDISRLEVSIERLEERFDKLDKSFTKKLNDGFDAFRIEIQHMFLVQDEKFERRFQNFASQMYILIDPLLKEMEIREQDRAIAASQHTQLEKRVTMLEKRSGIIKE